MKWISPPWAGEIAHRSLSNPSLLDLLTVSSRHLAFESLDHPQKFKTLATCLRFRGVTAAFSVELSRSHIRRDQVVIL